MHPGRRRHLLRIAVYVVKLVRTGPYADEWIDAFLSVCRRKYRKDVKLHGKEKAGRKLILYAFRHAAWGLGSKLAPIAWLINKASKIFHYF